MADFITVKVSELYDLVKLMKDDGMDNVEITILDEDKSLSDVIPACISLSANSKKLDYMSIDYGEIEALKEN